MSGFSGINQFGSLTTSNGTKIDYKYLVEKYDADGNGEISKDEFNTALKEEKLDKIDIAKINTNGDETIDEDEMAIYEQKYKMQEAVNAKSKEITRDFIGSKSQYIAQVTLELTNYITEFVDSYQGEVSKMAEEFTAKLPTKYAQIKADVLKNDPSSIKSNVLEEVLADIKTATETRAGETISDTAQSKIAKALDNEATKYMKANPNCTAEELKAHLEEFMNKSDAEKLADVATDYRANAASLGWVDSGELSALKEFAKDFLTQAVNQGVIVKLGGKNIATTNAITSALKGYSDGETLKKDMETAIANLSTVKKKDAIIAQDKADQAAAVEKNFANIKGEAYKVNAGSIDYSKIDSRYYNGGEIYQRGKGWSGSRDKAYDEGYSVLTSDNMKSQIKSQIETMLKEQGIAFDKIATVFENVYNQTAQDVLNSDGMITGRGARGMSSKGKAHIDVKTMVDNFITTFNTNIAKAIDEMNSSNKDMDIIDLDYSQAGKDENGKEMEVLNSDKTVEELYNSNTNASVTGGMALVYTQLYEKQAEKIINNMQKQMLNKAKAMCEANGIEFKNDEFTAMFNNAKSIAVNAGITGNNFEVTMNVKTLIDTFTDNFKQNYSTWVSTEASKLKNKK